jgi:hypothetical protein
MRTTLNLPDEVLKEAKAAAALRGISLKTYFAEILMLHRNVGRLPGGKSSERVELPLIGHSGAPRSRPSGGDLEQALAESENIPGRP